MVFFYFDILWILLITKPNISITNFWDYLNICIHSYNRYINYVVISVMAINYFSSQLMSPTMELAFAVGCLRQFRGDSLWSRCHSHSVFVSRFVNSIIQISNLYRLYYSYEMFKIAFWLTGCTRVWKGGYI